MILCPLHMCAHVAPASAQELPVLQVVAHIHRRLLLMLQLKPVQELPVLPGVGQLHRDRRAVLRHGVHGVVVRGVHRDAVGPAATPIVERRRHRHLPQPDGARVHDVLRLLRHVVHHCRGCSDAESCTIMLICRHVAACLSAATHDCSNANGRVPLHKHTARALLTARSQDCLGTCNCRCIRCECRH
jgi:hypothetical protein